MAEVIIRPNRVPAAPLVMTEPVSRPVSASTVWKCTACLVSCRDWVALAVLGNRCSLGKPEHEGQAFEQPSRSGRHGSRVVPIHDAKDGQVHSRGRQSVGRLGLREGLRREPRLGAGLAS